MSLNVTVKWGLCLINSYDKTSRGYNRDPLGTECERMILSLKPDVQKLIDDRVASGQYSTPEDVVAAAVISLDQKEQFGDFDTGELGNLLSEGERSIELEGMLDGDEAFRLRCERRAQKRKPPQ